MTAYCTLTNLVHRYGGDEVVARGWPDKTYTFLGESATSAALATDWPGAVADDVALVAADPAIYRYSGAAWAALTADKITKAIADASANIDGHLAGRYALPLASVPPVLELRACELARYLLFDDQVPELLQRRHDSSIRYLEKIGQGQLSLGVDSAGTEVEADDAVEMGASKGNVFDRDDTSFV